MIIRRIGVSGFRNLVEQNIDLSRNVNLFTGGNGQGKTNLIEAVYLLSTLRSFRTSRVKEVICWGKEKVSIRGLVEHGDAPAELRLEISAAGRKLWLGGNQLTSINDYLGKLKAVAFTPDDLRMVKEGPSIRRRFMDSSVFLFEPVHLDVVREFNRALRSRNRLLKGATRPDGDVLDSFTQAMSRSGARISASRKKLVKELEGRAAAILAAMDGGEKRLELKFGCDWKAKEDGTAEELYERLKRVEDEDIRRRTTTAGPHHDDFEILLDGEPARKYGSQGQQRSCAIALLLAIVERALEKGEEKPVILLDDVSSELDAERRKHLFERVSSYRCQILVTTTENELLQEYLAETDVGTAYKVEDGKLAQQEN